MNPAFIRHTIGILLTLWGATGRVLAQDEVKLDPLFSDNMVFQRDAKHIVRGKAPPRHYVSVVFHGSKPVRTDVSKAGDWEVEIDLRKTPAARLGELVVNCGPKKDQLEPALLLTNVAVGEVWILGVMNNKGVPAPQPPAKADTDKAQKQLANFRFVTISPLTASTNSGLSQSYQWHTCEPGTAGFRELRALTYFWAFYLAADRPLDGTYVGLIQTRTNELAGMVDYGKWESFLKRGTERAKVPGQLQYVLDAVWSWTRRSVRETQSERYELLVEAKHAGRVDKPDEVLDYDEPHIYLREAFRDAASWMPPFEGAVW